MNFFQKTLNMEKKENKEIDNIFGKYSSKDEGSYVLVSHRERVDNSYEICIRRYKNHSLISCGRFHSSYYFGIYTAYNVMPFHANEDKSQVICTNLILKKYSLLTNNDECLALKYIYFKAYAFYKFSNSLSGLLCPHKVFYILNT